MKDYEILDKSFIGFAVVYLNLYKAVMLSSFIQIHMESEEFNLVGYWMYNDIEYMVVEEVNTKIIFIKKLEDNKVFTLRMSLFLYMKMMHHSDI